MAKFTANQSLAQWQNFVKKVYGLPNDRAFPLLDLISNHLRFTMRALKGIRQGNEKKLKLNLLISISWFMSMANRLHIDMEKATWQRFPGVCSYCGHQPCICNNLKPTKRARSLSGKTKTLKTLNDYQKMFALIYPPEKRTLFEAGVHLAEETGEVNEAIHSYWGEHRKDYFKNIENEFADWLSCFFGVANSANIDVAKELAKMYYNNCHVCHQTPCICAYSFIVKFES